MKYIAKGNPPAALGRWFEGQKQEDGTYVNVRYTDMPSDLRQAIHAKLIAEQGALCCYTGLRISRTNSHIEHFLPQNQCTQHQDVAYANLLAALGTSKKQVPYGAHKKADWYDANLLVNPMRASCDSQFCFERSGEIKPVPATNEAAKTTISKLGLDHTSLTEMRKQAIDEALFSPRRLSIRQLETVAGSNCSLSNGQYKKFCYVIASVARKSAESAKRRAAEKRTKNKTRTGKKQ